MIVSLENYLVERKMTDVESLPGTVATLAEENIEYGRVGVRLRHNLVEGRTEHAGSLAESIATLTEEKDEHEKSPKTKPEDTEHMKLHEEMFAFCVFFLVKRLELISHSVDDVRKK